MAAPRNESMLGLAAGLSVLFIFAGTLVVSRMGAINTLTIYDVTALRFGIAAICVLPLIGKVDWSHLTWRRSIILATVGGAVFALFLLGGFVFAPVADGGIVVNGAMPIFAALMMPARQASVPQLVARGDLTQANALLQHLAGFVKFGAPILGGVFVAGLGPERAMLLDIATFGLAALVLTQLPSLPPVQPDAETPDVAPPTPLQSGGERVWQTLRSTPALQMVFAVTFLGVLVIMGFDVLSSIAVRDVLQADERLFGVLIGLVGLGSVLAGLALMLRKRTVNPWHDVILGISLLAVLPLSIALGTRLGDPALIRCLVAAGAFVGGLGNGLIIIQVSTLLQLLSPPAQLGRVSGLFQSTIAAAQLITIVATPLIVPTFFSIGSFFSWSTLALGLVAVATTLMVRRHPPVDPGSVPAVAPEMEVA